MMPSGSQAAVRLTALPAACGDCLVIEYESSGQPRRVLVDGGLGSSFADGLGTYLGDSGQPTRFDLVVVTHVDRDHIDGVIHGLRGGRLEADDMWFNGRDEIESLVSGDGRGVRQGDELSRLIPATARNRVVEHRAIHLPDDQPAAHDVAGARVTLLGPVRARLERLLNRWPEPSDRSDPGEGMDALLDAFQDPAQRGEGEFGNDSSAANGSSISFLFEVAGVSLLLTGDAFAADLEASIRQVLADRGLARLPVDLFKLSHHGSRQNLTDELLELIEPEAILVCTDGSKFGHPDADAMAKVREHYPTTPIHFSDDDGINPHIRERAALVGSKPIAARPLRLEFTSGDSP